MGKRILTLLYTLFCCTAAAQLPRLSPRPAEVISLNGEWLFQGRYPIQVPGEWEMQGFTVPGGETGVYSRALTWPAHWKGGRIKLRFDGVSSHAVVKVNHRKVGEHEGGFVPFEMDVTDALRGSRDSVQVEVQAHTVSDYLGCTSQYAAHTVGGLLRKVSLFALPSVNLSDLTTTTTFDRLYKQATLRIVTATTNESTAPATASVRFTLRDAAGKTVARSTVQHARHIAPGAAGQLEAALAVPSPKHWNPEQPYLYQLQTELLQNGQPIHTTLHKVGFRQVEVRGNELLVNGRPVKLRGVNRHDVHPLTGRSLRTELHREDALLFRNANCNYIRTSHYPPAEEFLEAADELGLFVESEAAITWVQHGASPIWKLWDYKDGRFLPHMIAANAGNIAAGKNHPSVIIWSLGNESLWSPLWEQVLAFVKKSDPTRPTTFHDQCWGGFNNAGSKADIAVYHYPGIDGAAAAAASNRPVLFGEYAHLACYNRRELATDPGVRAAYSAPLVQFYDSIYHYKGCLGGAIWSGMDDVFHLPGGRIVGYGPWGPVDAWRRPKPEYAGMKKAYEPVRIKPLHDAGTYLELAVQNRYDFTPLSAVNITVNGAPVLLRIPAGGSGTLRVPKKNGRVHVVCTDPRGFVCTEALFGDAPPPAPSSRRLAVTWEDAGGALFIRQGPYSYTVGKTTGIIDCLRKGSDTLLLQGPQVCVVPMNNDDGGKPHVAGETYQNNIYPLKNYPLYTLFAKNIRTTQLPEGVRVEMDVVYTNARGRLSYTFTSAGELVTGYEVTYTGNDSIPYQYGLLMQLPRRFEKLQWTRNGEFSVYAADDIARNAGEALLQARAPGDVEVHGVRPAGSWKDDANELGSNDFRSTKRYITRASLADHRGDRLEALSGGSQHSRAWLQDGTIHWLVADYANNGSERFYTTPHSQGRINIKHQPIKGKTIIRLP